MAKVCFDCGGTSIKYGLWDDKSLTHISSVITPPTLDEMMTTFKEVVNSFVSIGFEINGIAMSVPGSVDVDSGVIGGLSAIEYIHNFNFVSMVEELTGLPVSIENDANCAALAELYDGAAKGIKDALFVVVGTGIGGAVITEGKLQKGSKLYGGEFGYMLLDGERSFSQLGTAVNMAMRYNNRMVNSNVTLTGQEVFQKALEGDQVAIEEVETFYHYLATGIYNLQFTTDPEVIVIGGAISRYEALYEELKIRLEKMLKKVGMEDFHINIRPCKYLGDANLIGAAIAHQIKFKRS